MHLALIDKNCIIRDNPHLFAAQHCAPESGVRVPRWYFMYCICISPHRSLVSRAHTHSADVLRARHATHPFAAQRADACAARIPHILAHARVPVLERCSALRCNVPRARRKGLRRRRSSAIHSPYGRLALPRRAHFKLFFCWAQSDADRAAVPAAAALPSSGLDSCTRPRTVPMPTSDCFFCATAGGGLLPPPPPSLLLLLLVPLPPATGRCIRTGH